jgi:(4S)-4-hydroxy-5-phosphonooxypentane-2,3-dione isomerase
MYVVVVNISIKPANVEQFMASSLDNARHTRQEPGNLRFDVLRSQEDPSRFMLYEVYYKPEDHARHHQTEHYLRWKSAVADWMSEPRQAVKYQTLFFDNCEQ